MKSLNVGPVLGIFGILGGLIAGAVFQISVTTIYGYDYSKYNTILATACAISSIVFWIVLYAIGMAVQALEDSKAKLDRIISLLQVISSDERDVDPIVDGEDEESELE